MLAENIKGRNTHTNKYVREQCFEMIQSCMLASNHCQICPEKVLKYQF